ncbi:DUF6695 family protein [Elizabethkingia miricola]|uniref:Type VI secretion system effector TseH-like domain-containing protein n=2 Tax=Elizabethkingia TaxID=308865 RepID=A0ABD5B811_ELIMR|nr:DUF6695 family protein [Elizabethkingia miricola]MBS1740485.1 hypothetical protein [Bacteroidota bacterium]MDQ8750065.1 hypothetical protein [Elizabethkingia miricola]MDV3663235.1 hypothetical protein [Elizabethkingia anophelis]
MRNGIAIALAWPQTLCKNAGAWYDLPMKWLGLNKSNYYKVGHAAIVLINKKTGACHYFDFGRYHAPYQHGRVRSAVTDHDLTMKTKAVIENGELCNYWEIVHELFGNTSSHGDGDLHAAYCEIEFEKAYGKAIAMQQQSPIKYGPFLPKGTNCSRFVNTVILSGNPKWLYKLVLALPKTLSPTPIGNVKSLNNYIVVSANTPALKMNFNRIIFYHEPQNSLF